MKNSRIILFLLFLCFFKLNILFSYDLGELYFGFESEVLINSEPSEGGNVSYFIDYPPVEPLPPMVSPIDWLDYEGYLTAYSSDGYVFSHWLINGVELEGEIDSSLIVTWREWNDPEGIIIMIVPEISTTITAVFAEENPEPDPAMSNYEIISGNFSWNDALIDASQRFGQLAILDTQEKISSAQNYLDSLGEWPEFYIGLTDEVTEGDWRWIDGTNLTESNWKIDQPDSSLNRGGEEDYAVVVSSKDPNYQGKWGDNSANYFSNYVANNTNDIGGYLIEYVDTDGDGLSDRDEINTHQTDPNNPDTDGDGLSDGDEINTHQTDPNDADSDDDGLSDGDEVNNFRFSIVKSFITNWYEAKSDAEAQGGRLAVLKTQEQIEKANEFLLGIGSWDSLWIGLKFDSIEQEFRWLDGELLTSSNWDTGEPNFTENEETVVYIHPSYSGAALKWNNHSVSDSSMTSYLLERKTDPNNPDTDGDLLLDAKELELGSDPLVANNFQSLIPLINNLEIQILQDTISNQEIEIDNLQALTQILQDTISNQEIEIYNLQAQLSQCLGEPWMPYPIDDDCQVMLDNLSAQIVDLQNALDSAISERDAKLSIEEVKDLRVGSTMIEIHNGQATLTMEVEESDDLGVWTNGSANSIQIPIDAEAGKKFFRFKMSE